jgi:cyclic beta-1,2-glucan synthetase
LGVAAASECRIDTIAQSWSVLCGAADRTRATRAMAAVDELAVRRDADLIALFTPAFDVSAEDPGYIKGYPPGLRENGGQYTHGVIWSAVAFAELGDGDKAGELLGMLNPIGHGDSAEKIVRYKVEPYVTCGDLYTADGHLGRGGWTWYSGSGGWLYRAMLEWQLGLRVEGERLRIAPCIPRDWPGFRIDLRHGTAHYAIRVENPRKVCGGIGTLELDGTAYDAAAEIPLVDDGKSHVVRVELG